jgi:hypothetical protein
MVTVGVDTMSATDRLRNDILSGAHLESVADVLRHWEELGVSV